MLQESTEKVITGLKAVSVRLAASVFDTLHWQLQIVSTQMDVAGVL